MLWDFFFVVVSFVTGRLPWHPCMYTDELWMWTYFMDWGFPLNFVVKQQRHCSTGSRKLVLKLEWSNWSHTAFAFCQLCLSASDAVSLCVYCGIWDKWRVWETAWEAKSPRHAQLPICLRASPPAADPFEFNLREAVEPAWRRWAKQLHFWFQKNTMWWSAF